MGNTQAVQGYTVGNTQAAQGYVGNTQAVKSPPPPIFHMSMLIGHGRVTTNTPSPQKRSKNRQAGLSFLLMP